MIDAKGKKNVRMSDDELRVLIEAVEYYWSYVPLATVPVGDQSLLNDALSKLRAAKKR